MALFDNVTSMTINNKDVQSLKIGTTVLWEKAGPTPSKIATHITHSGSYLYLYDSSNNPIASASVEAYRNGKLQNTYTTNRSGRFTYNSRYNYIYEGDNTYEGCTYP